VSAKTQSGGKGLQQGGVAARAPSEAMIEPHDDLPHPELPVHHVLDECLRLHAGESRREGQHDRHLNTGFGDELQPLLESRDGHWRPFRLEHFNRLRIERAGKRGHCQIAAPTDRKPQDLAVTKVNAVEDPESNDAPGRLRRGGLDTPDNPHGRLVQA
jgi:hypothetical protein